MKTLAQTAKILGCTKQWALKLAHQGELKFRKLDPEKPQTPVLISETSIKQYLQKNVKPGVKAKRCEPCNHEHKKTCGECNKLICINDYRKSTKKTWSKRCKDCENKAKADKRNFVC